MYKLYWPQIADQRYLIRKSNQLPPIWIVLISNWSGMYFTCRNIYFCRQVSKIHASLVIKTKVELVVFFLNDKTVVQI